MIHIKTPKVIPSAQDNLSASCIGPRRHAKLRAIAESKRPGATKGSVDIRMRIQIQFTDFTELTLGTLFKDAKGWPCPMHAPSLESPDQLMICFNAVCNVGHKAQKHCDDLLQRPLSNNLSSQSSSSSSTTGSPQTAEDNGDQVAKDCQKLQWMSG